MEAIYPIDSFRVEVQPALQSKVEEFHLLGYDRATEEDVWACLVKKKWKKKDSKMLHQIVNDILTLTVNDFMTYLSVQALSEGNWFKENANA